MTSFIATSLIAPYRSSSSFRAYFSSVVRSENDKGIINQSLTRSAGVLGLLKVVKESSQSDIVFVYVIQSGRCRFTGDHSACTPYFLSPNFFGCSVGPMIGITWIIKEKRVEGTGAIPEMLIQEFNCMIRVTTAEVMQVISVYPAIN